jgi:hypothetical protein
VNFIPEADLVHRRLYRVRSRNLVIGVWDRNARGFIGLREKFGSRYPFMEFHHDADPHVGTAQAVRDLGIDLPMEIALAEYGPRVEREGRTHLTNNQPLLDLLEEHEPAILAEIRAEEDQAILERESLKWKPRTEAETRYGEATEATEAWRKTQTEAGRSFHDYRDEWHERRKADRKILEEGL